MPPRAENQDQRGPGETPAPDPLPPTLRVAVRQELRRTLRPPFETPLVVAINGALMSSCWVFLPGAIKDKVFTLHGSLAFALVLAAWMYSDVPATNVLGPDRERVLLALGDPPMVRRLLLAKTIVLWLLITPLCFVVALIAGLLKHDLLATGLTLVWIGVVPLGALALSNLVGIRFPYHPMPLRFRWAHRRPYRRMLVRWLTLAVTPYVLVPFIASALMAPTLLLWGLLTPHGLDEKLPDHDLGWGVALACAIAAVAWWVGQRAATWLTTRRAGPLVEFLSDPGRG